MRNNNNNNNNGHYDDLLQDEHDHQTYHNLHQLMQQQHGPATTPTSQTTLNMIHSSSNSNSAKNKSNISDGFINSNNIISNNNLKSVSASASENNNNNKSCDYNSTIIGGSGVVVCNGGGHVSPNSRETIITLNSDESKDLSTSSSTSSGISSSGSTSSPELACDAAEAGSLNVDHSKMALAAADSNNASSSPSSGDPLLLRNKSVAEIVSRLPKVSILKPLMGIDTNLAGNLETFFTMDYPRQSYEVLFCVETTDDPVVGLCQSLIDKYAGEVDARLFIGGEQVGVNPKINNMEPGYRESKYELIMISDAGIKSELIMFLELNVMNGSNFKSLRDRN